MRNHITSSLFFCLQFSLCVGTHTLGLIPRLWKVKSYKARKMNTNEKALISALSTTIVFLAILLVVCDISNQEIRDENQELREEKIGMIEAWEQLKEDHIRLSIELDQQ